MKTCLFARSSLLELKSEAARWHSASNQVEKDLGTLGALISALQIQATNEGTNEESTLVKEGPLTGRRLSQVVRVQEANKNRLQILRDGENLLQFFTLFEVCVSGRGLPPVVCQGHSRWES